MFSVAALRLALRELEVELPYTKDAEGRPLTVVLRALDPERALALRKRLPGSYYEAVQAYVDATDPDSQRTAEQELDDAEEVLQGGRMLLEEGIVGFIDPETKEFVAGRVRFEDSELDETTMDGRLFTAAERTTLAIKIATLSGEGEVASAHGRFRIRDRGRLQGGPRDVEVHPGNGSAAASAAAVADGGQGSAEVDQPA